MSKKLHFQGLIALFVTFCSLSQASAQFTLSGQLRTRTELRDGLGTLNLKGAKPAFFTSQRARLAFGYKWDRLLFNFSVQDVRVWGQDASSISNADGSRFMVHEAWGEVTLANSADTTIKFKLVENLSFKIGRQTLIYDDVRLLGDLDWLQQARRHDAALLKAQHKGWQVDLGAGFNQNTDAFGVTGTNYVAANVPAYTTDTKGNLVAVPGGFIPTNGKGGSLRLANNPSTNGMNQMYKSMQFLYVSRKFGQTKVSGLFFKDDFSKYRSDSIRNISGADTGYVYGRRYDQTGVNSRITYGLMFNKTIGNASGFKTNITAAAYWQSGKNKDGKSLNASHYTVALTFQRGKFSFGPGWDYLSGNEAVGGGAGAASTSATDNRFDPLYGTPHKFWGYMDYFYVGTGSAVGGLNNLYFKTKYTAKDFFITLDYHHFSLAKSQYLKGSDGKASTRFSNGMGSEVDLIINYNLSKFTNLELGYCFMKATNTLEYAKLGSVDKTDQSPQWAYLMINIRPDFFFAKPVAIKQ
ncbi:alginate export family protein [Cytophagaceae bacterium DM2B3-1]|uniref:Alginate export family protein n=1 Tax=Xanthocytophaga flava TaxID=3048013 RepID=A0ABT7CHQ7_9BACT|nr:alginate export family protein [Xanthocytophaga flavus]MDJ1492530.1 alginate export family protein [Xanthocytophaga flavus]